jgi:catechol 2,3-dioxygenase-like lactoylglutathione lyase family enzyme
MSARRRIKLARALAGIDESKGGSMSVERSVAARNAASVVKPMLLSHGTMMCRNMVNSRRFYQEFLGVEVVRHAKAALMLRLNTGMYIVCVCIGERVPNQHVMTHWGLNVASREEVDRAHAAALEFKEKYGIQQIKSVRERHGAYAFYLQDLDNNWWEIQYEPRTIDDSFNRGDIVDMSVVATDSAESHE